MKYEVGDKVRIKSLDWYKVQCMDDNYAVIDFMNRYWCGYEMTIVETDGEFYYMKEDEGINCWADEMIEGLVEDEMSLDKAGRITDFEYEGLVYTLLDGYIFKDENGNVINATKIVLEKKKKEYPKTYEECLKVLGIEGGRLMFNNSGITQYERDLYLKMNSLSKLLICRDAYWKIAEEEMGLGKSWEPSWLDDDTKKYVITSTKVFETFGGLGYINCILTFPTKEMRDAFYENFKYLIEECKELL